ncbi:hypothetical protein [Streptomyces hoynatensis]|uniref:Uncharacterized protein n=1 Tax=Streptomyces hoynatensis TaxID=1141874 RepID=A0A3A9Z808_9ACTN|nr:hypothetical protein [Streptomyces hoynatensis]RKN43974.1 hypothetical protein D7294_09845 [Streptomyces hoynatensis]
MSQPWQQPQPNQPGYGYPAQPQPQPGFGPPPQAGFGPPPAPAGYGYPPPGGAPVPVRPTGSQAGLGVALAAGAALLLVVLYGYLNGSVVDLDSLIRDAMEDGDSEIKITQLTWLAAAVGALVGIPMGKYAAGQAGYYWLAGALALGSMLLGQTFAMAVVSSDASDGAKSPFELFFDNFSDMWDGWTENAEGVTWLLIALAPAAAIFAGYLLGRTRRPAGALG